MEIKDKNGKLLAMVVDYISNKENKYFVTDNEAKLQVATFNLEKNDNILKHIHPPQQRNVKTTSEVLIILDGEIEYEIFDEDLEFCQSGIINGGSMLILISGGHGLNVKKNTKFIEVKQGPYNESIDKVRF